jgi:hypothetical protein
VSVPVRTVGDVPGFDLDELAEPCDQQRFVDPSCLPPEDWPEWSEADEAALATELIARDPARSERVLATDLVAAVESAPMNREALCLLAGVDIDELDGAGLVGFAAAWTRVANHAAAQVATAVARYRQRIGHGELLSPAVLTAAEFGVALRLGSGGADRLVATSTALAARLPATFAALHRGELSWAKATVIAERTAVLTAEDARRVEELVLPHAADRTPTRHAEAVRRAVTRVDPASAAERRRRAERDIALIRTHVGDGMGELFARMRSEDLDTVWTGADAWARRAKAAGDARTLDELRVAALVRWARSFLSHGDGAGCDTTCDSTAQPPTRHGRPVNVRVVWDLRSLLGLADEPGELADSGATVCADTIRELVASGAHLRRLLVDPNTGELVDLTPPTFTLPATDGSAHVAPIELHVVVPTDEWDALTAGTDVRLSDAVRAASPQIQQMLAEPITVAALDATPDAYPAPAALADFVATRDRHPSSPCAGLTAASASDLDHVVPVRDGGTTVRDNLATPTRRWHRLRTIGGWTVRRLGRGWEWISPTGRTTTTHPHDYRLGP